MKQSLDSSKIEQSKSAKFQLFNYNFHSLLFVILFLSESISNGSVACYFFVKALNLDKKASLIGAPKFTSSSFVFCLTKQEYFKMNIKLLETDALNK